MLPWKSNQLVTPPSRHEATLTHCFFRRADPPSPAAKLSRHFKLPSLDDTGQDPNRVKRPAFKLPSWQGQRREGRSGGSGLWPLPSPVYRARFYPCLFPGHSNLEVEDCRAGAAGILELRHCRITVNMAVTNPTWIAAIVTSPGARPRLHGPGRRALPAQACVASAGTWSGRCRGPGLVAESSLQV